MMLLLAKGVYLFDSNFWTDFLAHLHKPIPIRPVIGFMFHRGMELCVRYRRQLDPVSRLRQ